MNLKTNTRTFGKKKTRILTGVRVLEMTSFVFSLLCLLLFICLFVLFFCCLQVILSYNLKKKV